MVYKMQVQCDGACRNNGRSDAVGGAGIVVLRRWGKPREFSQRLSASPLPTNQRELSQLPPARRSIES